MPWACPLCFSDFALFVFQKAVLSLLILILVVMIVSQNEVLLGDHGLTPESGP